MVWKPDGLVISGHWPQLRQGRFWASLVPFGLWGRRLELSFTEGLRLWLSVVHTVVRRFTYLLSEVTIMSVIAELVSTLKTELSAIERELNAPVLTAFNTVLSMGNGLYIVTCPSQGVRATSISRCSRWERPAANRIVATADIRDGNGTSPVAVGLRVALEKERARAYDLLSTLNYNGVD